MDAIRWVLLPFVYIVACVVGVWTWLTLGKFSIARCPLENVWIGAHSGNIKCSWPIEVFFVKDVLGASVLAILIVVACVQNGGVDGDHGCPCV